jgi:hypothetical protein
MYRYKRDKEIRLKITDQEDEILQELAYQFYKSGIIKKPNIQALGRWSIIDQTLNRYRDFAIQNKVVRYNQQQQRQIQQKQQMWQKQLNNSAPSTPLLGYNLQQKQPQQQQNQQKQQQEKLSTIDDILAEKERQTLSDLESLEL